VLFARGRPIFGEKILRENEEKRKTPSLAKNELGEGWNFLTR
jgi:hypothetical protein